MDSGAKQVKERLNIVEVVSQYMQLRRAGRTHVGKCPFHKERTPSFHVSAERGTYKCFGCGEGGDVFSFVEKMEGIDFPTALKQLAQRAGVKLPEYKKRSSEQKGKEERLRHALEEASKFFEVELAKRTDVLQYLHSRGVKEETVKQWRLGYAPAKWETLSTYLQEKGFSKDELVEAGLAVKSEKKPGEIFDRFRGRIMFPITDAGGVVIAFSGRFFEKVSGSREESEPAKYINSPETTLFKKSRTLYGLTEARNAIRKADCTLLVEGQFDLILAHQSGLPFTVALSGTALTPEHLQMLGRLSKRLVLALDADSAGVRSGLKSAHSALQAGFDVKVPVFPQGKDPADLARENPELLKAAIRTSQTAIEFFLNALWPTAKDERSYKKIVEMQVLPLIGAIESRIDQEHFVRLVSARLLVPEAAVRAEVGKRTSAPHQEDLGAKEPADLSLSPFEKKIGMLLSHFGEDSEVRVRLKKILGAERFHKMEQTLLPHAESLHFRFERELGRHTDEATIAADMLADIERAVAKERFKMKFL